MNSSEPEESFESQAVHLFAGFLEQDNGKDAKFEELCREHPQHDRELRRLRENLAKLDNLLEPPDEASSGTAGTKQSGISGQVSSMKDAPFLLQNLTDAAAKTHRYSTEDEVGRGGMGVVMRSWDSHLRRQIATKVLINSEGADSGASKLDPRRIRRFLEEVQITGQLDHPGVVPVHELGFDDGGRLFFAMRLVKGRDLRTIIKLARNEEDNWNRTRALSALQRVCETMAFAHEHGVIHRDLKPANIMIGTHGETYVMDWGLAKVLEQNKLNVGTFHAPGSSVKEEDRRGSFGLESDALLTTEGTVIGTPSYMSPEQARGELESVGPASDVYSVGAMLYHLLQGHPPFLEPGEQASGSQVLDRVLGGPPGRLDSVKGSIPLELVAICERAMSRDPGERYPDMGKMANDLRAFLEGRVVTAYKTGAIAEFRTWVKRNRGMAAAIAIGFVIAIGGLINTAIVQARSNRALASKNTELVDARAVAEFEAERAKENEEHALASERIANEERTKVLRLADLEQVDELRHSARKLYPARPRKLDEIKRWLNKANALAERLPVHRRDLKSLQEAARNAQSAQSAVASSAGDESAPPLLFENNEQRWHHNQLVILTRELDELLKPVVGLRDEVSKRLEFASRVSELTVEGESAVRLWNRAIQSIQDPAECPLYQGLVITPQLGLLPIGRSDHSGLWEFLLVETGRQPELQMDGSLLVNEESGVVCVLLPGGRFEMGSRLPSSEHPLGSPFVDPWGESIEKPVHAVELDPFFISKYELTQAQWNRLAGFNPSVCKAGSSGAMIESYTWSNPVDNVTYFEATKILAQFGMSLPTEAQWEYSARAGTSSVFWNGDDSASMNGACNCADQTWASAPMSPQGKPHEPWTDSWIGSAPVGSYYPNPFGLHDTAGNLWEWCLDTTSSYATSVEVGTGLRYVGNNEYRIVRGGSFNERAVNLRNALREELVPEARSLDVGIRPVVLLEQ